MGVRKTARSIENKKSWSINASRISICGHCMSLSSEQNRLRGCFADCRQLYSTGRTKTIFPTKANRADNQRNTPTHKHYPRKICLAPKTIIKTFSYVIFQTILFQFIFVGSMLFCFVASFFSSLLWCAYRATSLWFLLSFHLFCQRCMCTSVCIQCLWTKSHQSICKTRFYVSKCSSRSNQIRKLRNKAWRRNAIFVHYNQLTLFRSLHLHNFAFVYCFLSLIAIFQHIVSTFCNGILYAKQCHFQRYALFLCATKPKSTFRTYRRLPVLLKLGLVFNPN